MGFLCPVPAGANPNDVRLCDPNTSCCNSGGTIAVTANAQGDSSGTAVTVVAVAMMTVVAAGVASPSVGMVGQASVFDQAQGIAQGSMQLAGRGVTTVQDAGIGTDQTQLTAVGQVAVQDAGAATEQVPVVGVGVTSVADQGIAADQANVVGTGVTTALAQGIAAGQIQSTAFGQIAVADAGVGCPNVAFSGRATVNVSDAGSSAASVAVVLPLAVATEATGVSSVEARLGGAAAVGTLTQACSAASVGATGVGNTNTHSQGQGAASAQAAGFGSCTTAAAGLGQSSATLSGFATTTTLAQGDSAASAQVSVGGSSAVEAFIQGDSGVYVEVDGEGFLTLLDQGGSGAYVEAEGFAESGVSFNGQAFVSVLVQRTIPPQPPAPIVRRLPPSGRQTNAGSSPGVPFFINTTATVVEESAPAPAPQMFELTSLSEQVAQTSDRADVQAWGSVYRTSYASETERAQALFNSMKGAYAIERVVLLASGFLTAGMHAAVVAHRATPTSDERLLAAVFVDGEWRYADLEHDFGKTPVPERERFATVPKIPTPVVVQMSEPVIDIRGLVEEALREEPKPVVVTRGLSTSDKILITVLVVALGVVVWSTKEKD